MSRGTKVGLVVAVLFVLINLAGAGIAAASGEWIHTGLHAVLVVAGELVVWRLARRRVAHA
jgi:hypothetical protein